jgi:hypothetical protein
MPTRALGALLLATTPPQAVVAQRLVTQLAGASTALGARLSAEQSGHTPNCRK